MNFNNTLSDNVVYTVLQYGCSPNYMSLAGILQESAWLGAMTYYNKMVDSNTATSKSDLLYRIAKGVYLSDVQINELFEQEVANTGDIMIQKAAKLGYDYVHNTFSKNNI